MTIKVDTVDTISITLTPAEIDAIHREVEYLDPFAEDPDAWGLAVDHGPCFCVDRFVCTKHKIRRGES